MKNTTQQYQALLFDSKELYDRILNYFDVQELVTPWAYAKFKQRGDYFFLSRIDPRLLITILFIRETTGRKMTINTYKWGGRFDERGVRDNLSPLVMARKTAYWSGHVFAMAVDFDLEDMTATQARAWLSTHADELPFKIRLEHKLNGVSISWVHLDVVDDPRLPKVYLFNV
tara:strand:- start:43572 stop:44087 length:516 start_codon:yes stop_codon:yes gene_type:complete